MYGALAGRLMFAPAHRVFCRPAPRAKGRGNGCPLGGGTLLPHLSSPALSGALRRSKADWQDTHARTRTHALLLARTRARAHTHTNTNTHARAYVESCQARVTAISVSSCLVPHLPLPIFLSLAP